MQYVNERLFAFNTSISPYLLLLVIRLCLFAKQERTRTLNGNLERIQVKLETHYLMFVWLTVRPILRPSHLNVPD